MKFVLFDASDKALAGPWGISQYPLCCVTQAVLRDNNILFTWNPHLSHSRSIFTGLF